VWRLDQSCGEGVSGGVVAKCGEMKRKRRKKRRMTEAPE
jgi:hypothetical protein